jgi:hypothetical protein
MSDIFNAPVTTAEIGEQSGEFQSSFEILNNRIIPELILSAG